MKRLLITLTILITLSSCEQQIQVKLSDNTVATVKSEDIFHEGDSLMIVTHNRVNTEICTNCEIKSDTLTVSEGISGTYYHQYAKGVITKVN